MTEAFYTCPKCQRTSHNPSDVAQLYCGHCHLFAEQLRDEVVTRFAHLTKQRVTKRECFTLAALTMADACQNPDARLVHGLVPDSFNPGRYVQHAWVEMPATGTLEDGSTVETVAVIDYTQPDDRAAILPRDFYLERTKPLAMRHFTLAEVAALAAKHGVDGPWEESPREGMP